MSHRILTGTMSTFGGPDDMGVAANEGLALCEPSEMSLYPVTMFLQTQPVDTTGLARRLNPQANYVAARWDYNETPRDWLQQNVVIVTNPATGKASSARPIDWGPHEDTGRVCDLSPGLAEYLGLTTDDTCTMKLPLPPVTDYEAYQRIVISSGHGLKVRGASGFLDEVDEARNVVERLATELRNRGVAVKTFHDNTSTSQGKNLETIVAYHNAQARDLDISVHFNAYQETTEPMGTECLYQTQNTLSSQISAAISSCGFINRGAKKRTDLYFLNNTKMPAILIEVCFVDSEADADLYSAAFGGICSAMATVLGGLPSITAPSPGVLR